MPFLWDRNTGASTPLGGLPNEGVDTYATLALSDDGGTVVSNAFRLNDDFTTSTQAFVWREATNQITELPPLPGDTNTIGQRVSPDGRWVVGNSASDLGVEATRWDTQTGEVVGLGV